MALHLQTSCLSQRPRLWILLCSTTRTKTHRRMRKGCGTLVPSFPVTLFHSEGHRVGSTLRGPGRAPSALLSTLVLLLGHVTHRQGR